MSGRYIPAALRLQISKRASGRCEYCLVHEDDVIAPHEPDHITAGQHGGSTSDENLAYACFHCNRFKGTNLASIDPETRQKTFLFNPRRDKWQEHFKLRGAQIIGLTPVGRATVALLNLNESERLDFRVALLKTGRWGT